MAEAGIIGRLLSEALEAVEAVALVVIPVEERVPLVKVTLEEQMPSTVAVEEAEQAVLVVLLPIVLQEEQVEQA